MDAHSGSQNVSQRKKITSSKQTMTTTNQHDSLNKAIERVTDFIVASYPLVRRMSIQFFETVFVPKAIMQQVMLLFFLEIGLVSLNQFTNMINSVMGAFSSRTRVIRQLREQQRTVSTQDEWMDLAERIDFIQSNDEWRNDPSSSYYDYDRISARIDEFVHLMRRQDIFELMFVLRGSIGRNKFGLLHEDLFNRAMAGTKVFVETYHNVVCAALDFVCDADVLPGEDPIPTEARLAFFNETRHAYGRTALLLSGGATLGFYHVGVVRTLMANNLMPRVLGGSSAGSIVCAMIGTRTDEECINDLFEAKGTNAPGHSGELNLNFFRPVSYNSETDPIREPKRQGTFWEVYYNTAGAFRDMKRTIQGFVPWPLRHFSSFLFNVITLNTRPQDLFKHDTNYFRQCLKSNIGDFTFQEAFDRTGRILNIVVTPLNRNDPPRLLNYLTAPHVLVWSAAVASSSLPGVFEANRLVVKEADGWERYESGSNQAFSDGSMETDLPMQQLSEMFNVNHFIISQANAHAVMFASYNQKTTVWTSRLSAVIQSIMTFLKDQVRQWLANLVKCIGISRSIPFLGENRGLPTQFLTQEYEGRSSDISLIPWLNHRSLLSALMHIIYNPSEAEFRDWIQAAERETWRHIPAIKSHIAEEITLDHCVQRLRKRLRFESWQKQSKISDNNGQKLGKRLPSFIASPSLANFGGLGITDQPSIDMLRNKDINNHRIRESTKPEVPDVAINPGWAGMGLRGNRSSGNLARNSSDASGLFVDDEEGGQPIQQQSQQEPGETHVEMRERAFNRNGNACEDAFNFQNRYLKTSSMAQFYYRKTVASHGSTGDLRLMTPNAKSCSPYGGSEEKHVYERRKSKSYGDLGNTAAKVQFDCNNE